MVKSLPIDHERTSSNMTMPEVLKLHEIYELEASCESHLAPARIATPQPAREAGAPLDGASSGQVGQFPEIGPSFQGAHESRGKRVFLLARHAPKANTGDVF